MPRRPRSADLLGLERDTTTLRARQKWLSVFDILGDYEFGMPTVRPLVSSLRGARDR
jgi:hypothetical protein